MPLGLGCVVAGNFRRKSFKRPIQTPAGAGVCTERLFLRQVFNHTSVAPAAERRWGSRRLLGSVLQLAMSGSVSSCSANGAK